MADSRDWTEEAQDKPRKYFYSSKQGIIQRMMGTCPKDTEANLNGFPVEKQETI